MFVLFFRILLLINSVFSYNLEDQLVVSHFETVLFMRAVLSKAPILYFGLFLRLSIKHL